MRNRRNIELRVGSSCAVHDMATESAAVKIREGIPLPGGIDACRSCLTRVREHLKAKSGEGK